MKKSKIFFIATVIGLIITIICICIEKKMTKEFDNNVWKKDSSVYLKAEVEYEMTGDRTKLNRYEEEQEEMSKLEDKRDILLAVYIVTGGITVIMLVTGIILKIKEKTKNKN